MSTEQQRGDGNSANGSQLTYELKFQALLAQLEERYNASHNMRERGTQFTLWITGMAIGLAWLLISNAGLSSTQRIALTLLIGALTAGSVVFLKNLRKGFDNNRKTMIACERSLGMHDKGTFLKDLPLLPEAYAENRRRWGDHFNTLILWVSIVALALILLTWTSPQVPAATTPSFQNEKTKEANPNGRPS